MNTNEAGVRPAKLPGIHALRAFAALTIYVAHVVVSSPHLSLPLAQLSLRHLVMAVQLFFVVSAFSLMYSTRPYAGSSRWVARFYLKRYARIAPLFYVMMPVTAFYSYWLYGTAPTVTSTLLSATFLFNVIPEYSPSLVWAGWSVGVEMLFYLVFPVCILFLRGVRSTAALLLVSIVVGELARPALDRSATLYLVTPGQVSIVTNFRFFVFGILAFHVYEALERRYAFSSDTRRGPAWMVHLALFALCGALTAAVVLEYDWLRARFFLDWIIWGVVFAVLTVWMSVGPFRWLDLAPVQLLGERSYSLYLIHLPIIVAAQPYTMTMFRAFEDLVGPLALAATLIAIYIPVVAISFIAYSVIERPGIALGHRLERRLRGVGPRGVGPRGDGPRGVGARGVGSGTAPLPRTIMPSPAAGSVVEGARAQNRRSIDTSNVRPRA